MPLASTDFAVPLLPAIATPPIPGSTAANSRAVLILSCPTTAVKGKFRFRFALAVAVDDTMFFVFSRFPPIILSQHPLDNRKTSLLGLEEIRVD